jgi:hypothetical protein
LRLFEDEVEEENDVDDVMNVSSKYNYYIVPKIL